MTSIRSFYENDTTLLFPRQDIQTRMQDFNEKIEIINFMYGSLISYLLDIYTNISIWKHKIFLCDYLE